MGPNMIELFTLNDLNIIEKHEKFREKNIHHWKWQRWIVILTSFFFIGLMLFFMSGIQAVDTKEICLIKKINDNIELEMVMPYIDHRLKLMQLRIEASFFAFIFGITGFSIFIITLAKWNKHLYEGIINSIVIFKIREEIDKRNKNSGGTLPN